MPVPSRELGAHGERAAVQRATAVGQARVDVHAGSAPRGATLHPVEVMLFRALAWDGIGTQELGQPRGSARSGWSF